MILILASFGSLGSAYASNIGFSGYLTSSIQVIDQVIREMNQSGCTIYRISFSPLWSNGNYPYNQFLIQYYLDHSPSNWKIIVDVNHLYPPTEANALDARIHWAGSNSVVSGIFLVLSTWPNNSRVGVELINEYVSSDFYSRMQSLITQIRTAGYTNMIVVNKWSQHWQKLYDPLDNTWQGTHYYFDCWDVYAAVSDLQDGLKLGIKMLNTEVGASCQEKATFDKNNVNLLNGFVSWCMENNVDNCIWQNHNIENLATYYEFGLEKFAGPSYIITPKQPDEPIFPENSSAIVPVQNDKGFLELLQNSFQNWWNQVVKFFQSVFDCVDIYFRGNFENTEEHVWNITPAGNFSPNAL